MSRILASMKALRQHEELNRIVILSSTVPGLSNGPAELSDLFSMETGSNRGDKILIRAHNQKIFLFWLFEISNACSWAVDDASAHLGSFFNGTKDITTFLYSDSYENDDKNELTRTFLVTAFSSDSEAFRSVSLSAGEMYSLDDTWPDPRLHSKHAKRTLVCKLAVLFLSVLVILVSGALFIANSRKANSRSDLWMHWDTNGSSGLRNQLQFTSPHPDFQTWAKQSKYEDTAFFVRIDDQSMIPEYLIDDTERKYQKWFADRYPEMRAVRDSGAYVNESFHAHSPQLEFKSDRYFHPAHCILALRRYWQAKETGRHVCPRDVDHKHIKHCLDSLDNFAFVEGQRGTEPALPIVNDNTQPWLPNACF